jgi:hypothetical protein
MARLAPACAARISSYFLIDRIWRSPRLRIGHSQIEIDPLDRFLPLRVTI